MKKPPRVPAPPPTGWDKGLSQDYDRGLANWFSSRLDAYAVLRRWFPKLEKKTVDK